MPFALMGFLALAWPVVRERTNSSFRLPSRAARKSLWWLLLFLFLVPLAIGILFARTGTAFYERYGVVALIPCALVPVLFLGFRTHCDRLAASIMVFVLAILFVLNTSGKPWLVEQLSNLFPPKVAARILCLVALPPVGPAPLKWSAIPSYLEKDAAQASPISKWDNLDPDIPVVAGTGPTFIELDRYEHPALTERLYLLTNHEAASTVVHSTVFDHYELVKAAFPLRGRVEDYCVFLSGHSQFLVLGGYNHPDNWLLRKLEMDGARMRIIGTYNDDVIEEHQIYRVNVEKSPCGTQP
jgi:uncharacterized membrane protein YhaH (DUF805 family)